MAMPQRDDPPSLLRASASALCAMADKMADKLRKSSGWNRLRQGYGGSSALLEYAVMHGDEVEATVVLSFGQRSGGRWMGIGL